MISQLRREDDPTLFTLSRDPEELTAVEMIRVGIRDVPRIGQDLWSIGRAIGLPPMLLAARIDSLSS